MKKQLIGVGLCFSVLSMTNQSTMANTINTDSKVTVSYMTQEQAQKNLENVQKVEDIKKEPLMTTNALAEISKNLNYHYLGTEVK